MTLSSKILVVAASAAMLTAPVAAFATPVAVGGTGTRGAHSMTHRSMRNKMMMRKKMMMKKQMMMKKGM